MKTSSNHIYNSVHFSIYSKVRKFFLCLAGVIDRSMVILSCYMRLKLKISHAVEMAALNAGDGGGGD